MFYALIIISLVLAVGLTVFSLIFGGLPLADIIKNSQKAFFAADAGAECVLYWDIKKDITFSNGILINCFNEQIVVTETSPDIFKLTLSNGETIELKDSGVCLDIIVDKSVSPATTIKSSGHSPCQAGARNRVERTLEVSYE